MAGRKLRIGFIGSGHIARVHAEALRAMKGVRLTACADVDPANAKRLAETFGCKPTTDIAEVIAASDAVWVCSPPKCHRQHAVACLDAGRAVYCEKPLATTLADGRAIVRQAGRSGVPAAIGFNFRFHAPWRKCKSLLAAGDLGEPVMFLCQRLDTGPTGGWRRDPKQLCGMTIESVSHDVDLMRSLLGDVWEVSARLAATDPAQPGFDNCLIADLKLRSGCIASFQATWASAVRAVRHGVIATAGTVLIEGPKPFQFARLRVAQAGQEGETTCHFASPSNPLRGACEHFVAAVRDGVPLEIPIHDGLRALEVCTAMVRSARSGGAVVSLPRRGRKGGS